MRYGGLARRLLIAGTFGVCASASGASAGTLSRAGASVSSASGVSWATAEDAWETRTTGVFSTDNAGRSWQRIYSQPALKLIRLSAQTGVIALGTAPDSCMCTTRQLWTDNDGATWHPTVAIGEDFTGGDGQIYWWSGALLHEVAPFPPANAAKPLQAKLALTVPNGEIVDGIRTADGFAFLVSNRVDGRHWDTSPRVVLAGASGTQIVQLPAAPNGEILAQSITADGPDLTVTADNFGVDPVASIVWTSADAGQTWSLSA
jgi:hypothetical protein